MRRALTALAGGLLAAALPATSWAAPAWTLDVAPSIVTQHQSTDFALTATNNQTNGSSLGCIQVDLPASFVITAIGTPVASNGFPWIATRTGNTVLVRSSSGSGRLKSAESVEFTITATPTVAGYFAWSNSAMSAQDCSGPPLAGTAVPITVLPASTATPTATSTPTPTATPTPRPTATPDPGVSVPPVDPSPTPRPGDPTPTPAPSARPTPVAPSPAATPGNSSNEVTVAPIGRSPDGGSDSIGSGLDVLAVLDGPFVWFVPGAAVGVPGLLVVLFVALQALGVLAWIPAVRRMGGDDKTGPRRSRVSRGA